MFTSALSKETYFEPDVKKKNQNILGLVFNPLTFTFGLCTFIYIYLYAAKYLSKNIVLGGDTQLLWSVHYLFYYSLKHYHEFIWWDPTGINGWPIYYFLTAGGYSLLSPISFFASLLFLFLNIFIDLDINKYIVFQHTIYYFGFNLFAVILISRQLVSTNLSRIFIAITFTLGSIPFGGLRDSYMMAALPAALFYIFGLIYFNQNRTRNAFYLMMLLTAIFLSSLCYGVALSSLYWTSLFSIFLIIAYPSFLSSVLLIIKNELKTRKGKILLSLSIAICISGLIVSMLPVLLHANDFVRTPGGILNFSDQYAGWVPPVFGVPSYQLWRILLAWMPLREFHDVLFQFDIWKAGIDHLYIGLATFPLIVAAFVLKSGRRNPYVLMMLLIVFICMCVIPYTYDNLLIHGLMQKFKFFQNIRTMPDLLLRDGVLLFLIFIAGIGLDSLLKISGLGFKKVSGVTLSTQYLRIITILAFLSLIFFSALTLILGMSAKLPHSPFKALQHGLTYFGIYLGLFSILSLMILLSNRGKNKEFFAFAILLLTILDLTTSSSQYWKDGKVWYANGGPHTLPNKNAGPISSEAEHWAEPYSGVFHHIFMDPFYGDKTWLVLASRPKMAALLENWNRDTRRVKSYPYFRYFNNGYYIPFSNINNIDGITLPNNDKPWFVFHDSKLQNKQNPEILNVTQNITHFSFNSITVHVSSPSKGFMIFYDNKNPYWEARVNGKKETIYPANFTFKAIEIPEGNSVVEWVFNPYPVKFGLFINYFVLLLFIGSWYRNRNSSHF